MSSTKYIELFYRQLSLCTYSHYLSSVAKQSSVAEIHTIASKNRFILFSFSFFFKVYCSFRQTLESHEYPAPTTNQGRREKWQFMIASMRIKDEEN